MLQANQGGGMLRPGGTLTIPNDPARWEQMQRSLVVGGVYHVQMTNGHKKYCLWNGSQLVPCKCKLLIFHLDCLKYTLYSIMHSQTCIFQVSSYNLGLYSMFSFSSIFSYCIVLVY